MKNYKRAQRRFHRERIRNKRKSYWNANDLPNGHLDDVRLGIVTSTPATCSCWMCGNPRKYWGDKTRQELMSEEKFKWSLEEYFAA